MRDTIPRLSNLGSGSLQAYNVMATATDYLPEAIGGYLRLPRQFADSRPVDHGKTSLMILIDQLDVAETAGLDAGTARAEDAALAAAVVESAPGAAASWAAAVGGATTQDFFDAATRGRR